MENEKKHSVHVFIEIESFCYLIFVKNTESSLITLLLANFFVIFRTFTINRLL